MSPRRSWKLASVSGFRPLPLDPAGGLPSQDHLFCPPVANFWLRPCFRATVLWLYIFIYILWCLTNDYCTIIRVPSTIRQLVAITCVFLRRLSESTPGMKYVSPAGKSGSLSNVTNRTGSCDRRRGEGPP